MNDSDRYAVSLENMEVLRAQVEAQAREIERLRMQLVACGVVALANTPESAAKARDMHTDYMSASCGDVIRTVDIQMQLRAELAALKAQPTGVVLPPHCTDRAIPVKYRKGWNCCISEVARLNQPASAGDSALREAVTPNVLEWSLAADELPSCGKPVLAYYLNSHGKGRRIRAEYVKAWTVQADDLSDPDTECVEYSEKEDAYYIRQGWYELIDNWDEYGRIAVHEGVITHWQELPAAPSAGSQEQGE